MNQPIKLIEERHKRRVSCFSSLFSRLSCTYCYLLQDTFMTEMALLHFSVPMIHRPQHRRPFRLSHRGFQMKFTFLWYNRGGEVLFTISIVVIIA